MGGAQDPRAYAGGGGLGLRDGQVYSDGSPSQYLQRPKKLVGGERDCNGGPAHCMPLSNHALLLW